MPHTSNLCYEFGSFHLDPNNRVLTCNGDAISIAPKAAEILILLLANAGQLVEKDVLLREVWPNTFVEEANLTQTIFILRRTLGDDPSAPKFIETVVRHGYRFIAPVSIVDVHKPQSANSSLAIAMPQRPVVAVLPFLNNSGNNDLEYLADGVTDNLINHLSRVSQLRVMSHSAVSRYKTLDQDPRRAGKDLGATAVLVGRLNARPAGIGISVELVAASNGWQLWGESFDSGKKDILEIQDAITGQILTTLKLKLTGEEEKRVTARYTENAAAYQAYLEGRYHWGRYTRQGIEKAIGHFRSAIDLDPNYALAYSAIVDCYLRLATNYLPPEQEGGNPISKEAGEGRHPASDPKLRLRFQWDWKGAERELRRASELRTNFPTAHQWYAAYLFSREGIHEPSRKRLMRPMPDDPQNENSFQQLFSPSLSPSEEIQVFCNITREQIEIGNYDAGLLMLRNWWNPGEWPDLEGLNSYEAADLLFTIGSLTGCLSSTGRLQWGQKHAEDLLSGSIGIFAHLGTKRRVAEARIELALSYYRQGMFDLSRNTLIRVLAELDPDDSELMSLGLIRLAVVERHSGHVSDSLSRFSEAHRYVEEGNSIIAGRYYQELATSIELMAFADNKLDLLENATNNFQRARYEFEAIGHHRYAAVAEHNEAFLLMKLGRLDEAETHLNYVAKVFGGFNDVIRKAQVEDTLARLYMIQDRMVLSETFSRRAVDSLETNDENALLAEALTTRGIVLCRIGRRVEARAVLEGARRIAERCGDWEGAGRALLVMVEEMGRELDKFERSNIADRVRELLQQTQINSTRTRLEDCLKLIAQAS